MSRSGTSSNVRNDIGKIDKGAKNQRTRRRDSDRFDGSVISDRTSARKEGDKGFLRFPRRMSTVATLDVRGVMGLLK